MWMSASDCQQSESRMEPTCIRTCSAVHIETAKPDTGEGKQC